MPGWYIRVGPLCPVCKCSKEYRAYISDQNIDENFPMNEKKSNKTEDMVTPCYCTNCRVVSYIDRHDLRKPEATPKVEKRKMVKVKAPSRWRIEIDRLEESQ